MEFSVTDVIKVGFEQTLRLGGFGFLEKLDKDLEALFHFGPIQPQRQ
jgi:hypothetical protein